MAVLEGQVITHQHFNALVTSLVNNYSSNLGQLLNGRSSFKSAGDIIDNRDWEAVAEDIVNFAYFAYTGFLNTKTDVIAVLFTNSQFSSTFPPELPADAIVDETDYNELEAAIQTAINKLPIAYTELSSKVIAGNYDLSWNGELEIITQISFTGGYEYTISGNGTTATATSAAHRRHYSNSGARIFSNGTGSGATTDKDIDWDSIIDGLSKAWDVADYTAAAFEAIDSGSGNTTYTDSSADLAVKFDSDTGTYTVAIIARDNTTEGIDEDVDTNVGLSNRVYYPNRLENNLEPI